MAKWGMKLNNPVQISGTNLSESSPGIWNLDAGGVAEIILVFGGTGLEIDNAAEVSFNNIVQNLALGDDFGVDDILSWDATSEFNGAPCIAATPYTDLADALIIFPTSPYNLTVTWDLQPISLGNTAPNSPAFNSALLSPYKPTVWNGMITVMQQWKLTYRITNNEVTPGLIYIFYDNVTGIGVDGYISGQTGVFPPQPFVVGVGQIDLGGSSAIRALTDASGIYTLVPGQYKDELYQRVGGTASTIEVSIPDPFFKTGFIGDD